MLNLTGKPLTAPWEIDCENGVKLMVKPYQSSAMRSGARRDARERVGENPPPGALFDALVHAFAVRAVVSWTGVGDAKGEPIDPTPALIDELLDSSDTVYRAFEAKYITPALELDAEKNVS